MQQRSRAPPLLLHSSYNDQPDSLCWFVVHKRRVHANCHSEVCTDPPWNWPDPYVTVSALISDNTHTKSTNHISGAVAPTWDTVLNFGCQNWESFLILQIWDSDIFYDDKMSTKQKIVLSSGNHLDNRHNAYDSGHMIFDYNFTLDVDECATAPCQNGATCMCWIYLSVHFFLYRGTNCEHLYGDLHIQARRGYNLPDEDGWWHWWDSSDPYMRVIAIDADGNEVTRRSEYVWGNQSPVWNEGLEFGSRMWKSFKVQVFDSDINADDPLWLGPCLILGHTLTRGTTATVVILYSTIASLKFEL